MLLMMLFSVNFLVLLEVLRTFERLFTDLIHRKISPLEKCPLRLVTSQTWGFKGVWTKKAIRLVILQQIWMILRNL